MAVLNREDYFRAVNERVGNDTSDEALAFLENMTDKMEKPVANISAIAHTICEEHQSLSNDYMSSMVAKMQTDAAKVTELLDDLIRSAVNVKNDQRPNNHE